MMEWIKKNRELLIPVAGGIAFVICLALLGVFFKGSNSGQKGNRNDIVIQEKVEIKIPDKNSSGQNNESVSQPIQQTEVFFLQPSAGEIIDAVADLSPVEFDEKTQDYPGLKVMWPLYFYKLGDSESKSNQLLLDVSEDGFGVLVECDADMEKYPHLADLEVGELLWVAGEIVGLSGEGTGYIQLATEQIRFGGTKEKPPAPISYEKSKK